MERLNQKPSNSSRPSGSLAPWDKGVAGDEDDESTSDENDVLRSEPGIDKEESSNTADTTEKDSRPSKENTEQRQPGRQSGSQGFGRTQQLAVSRASENACPATQLYSSCPFALIAAEYHLPVRLLLCVLVFPWRQKKDSATISRTLGKIERTVSFKSSIWDALKGKKEGSMVDIKVAYSVAKIMTRFYLEWEKDSSEIT